MINDDECLAREYVDNKRIIAVLSDIQFEKELTLNLGGITAMIFHTVSPHSEDTVLIYIPEEKILFLGDSTSLIESFDCKYCILSHAEPLTKSDLLDYLKSILK